MSERFGTETKRRGINTVRAFTILTIIFNFIGPDIPIPNIRAGEIHSDWLEENCTAEGRWTRVEFPEDMTPDTYALLADISCETFRKNIEPKWTFVRFEDWWLNDNCTTGGKWKGTSIDSETLKILGPDPEALVKKHCEDHFNSKQTAP